VFGRINFLAQRKQTPYRQLRDLHLRFFVTLHHAEPEAAMEQVSVALMAPAKLQGWTHAARGREVSGSVPAELNRYVFWILLTDVF